MKIDLTGMSVVLNQPQQADDASLSSLSEESSMSSASVEPLNFQDFLNQATFHLLRMVEEVSPPTAVFQPIQGNTVVQSTWASQAAAASNHPSIVSSNQEVASTISSFLGEIDAFPDTAMALEEAAVIDVGDPPIDTNEVDGATPMED